MGGDQDQDQEPLMDDDGNAALDKCSRQIIRQYALLKARAASEIQERRARIRSYRPGKWVMESGGFRSKDFAVPKLTTLLVVGPMGAGKSTLINNLVRVINELNSGFDRAQVCCDPSDNGTLFLKEHMLCDNCQNICVYDTRGFSEMDIVEDMNMMKKWMQEGVQHGEAVQRCSDGGNRYFEMRARHGHHKFSLRRQVDFVIFVVSALAIPADAEGSNLNLAKLYKSPLLAFKDDRPVVVMTHGDELSLKDRVAARVRLGSMLGVSPVNQIFDIPGFTGRSVEECDEDLATDVVMLDMLEYAIRRADRNLSYQPSAGLMLKQALLAAGVSYNTLDPIRKGLVLGMLILWVLLALGAFIALTWWIT